MQQWLYLGYQVGQCCSVSLHMLGASPLNSKLYSLLNIIQQTSDFRNLFPRGQNLLLLYSQSQWGTDPATHLFCFLGSTFIATTAREAASLALTGAGGGRVADGMFLVLGLAADPIEG